MATFGEFGASSFDSYEGIRIVIPGVVAFTAAYSTYHAVAPNTKDSLGSDALLSLVASVVVGLILYFWDLPARSAAYSELQPTDHLEQRFPEVNPASVVTAYLLILNTKMPTNTRNRSLYMGSMYRIGLEMILALAISSSVVFGASLFDYGKTADANAGLYRRLAAAAMFVTFLIGVSISRAYDRKEALRLRESNGWKLSAAFRNLLHRSMWVYVAGLIAICIPLVPLVASRLTDLGERATCAGGLALCMGYWAQRYVRGDAVIDNPRKRRRLRAPSAGLLFGTPLVATLALYQPKTSSVLTGGPAVTAWTAVAALALLTIMIRGHERKLHGTYRGQTRWLQDFPEAYADILPGRGKGTRTARQRRPQSLGAAQRRA